jgi:tetratricopeptide (TPR) repeat protein
MIGYGVYMLGWVPKNEQHFDKPDAVPTIELSPEELPAVGESVTKDGYTITNEGVGSGVRDISKIPLPNYSVIPKRQPSVAAESYSSIVDKMKPIIADITKQLESNAATGAQALYTDGWLDLALYRNMLGDVAGAEAIWRYLVAVSPGLVQPYGNLANMYLVQKNWGEAEKWYKEALVRMPEALQYYQDLADMYAAEQRDADYVQILTKGIEADKKAWSLQVTLGRYYNERGDIKNAHMQFNAAIERAKKAGNTAAVEAIEQEKIYVR